ncbi:uncharacterized protein LOC127762081 [Oryza glaberrima]|uniref:uncharacterized protein LOC127762081 n=1 Tax=Oryza glaberrima TaxID=4538 RepID=UPI00224C2F56|nr:uncharacterized protein LOC127762081 [Oryza glaberrima]
MAPPRFPTSSSAAAARRPPRSTPPNRPRPSPAAAAAASPAPASPLEKALLEEVLLHAAFEGNLRIFRKVVRALDEGEGRLADKVGAVRDSDGLGALHLAAAREKLPVCQYLVEELRVDVDAVDNKGETALTFAINCGNEDMVRYLLDHGADTEKLNNDGLTALHFAAGEGKCKIVEILLSKGAYIDSLTTGGTALHCAAYNGRDAVVKILLDHHADLGHMPIEVAARCGEWKAVEILFPVTSRIQSVPDWTVDGIINHVKSLPEVKEEDFCEATLDMGKFQGREAVKNKDYLGAMNIYTAAIALNPTDASLFSNRSLCWLHLGEGKKALMDAEACRMMRPDWPKACYRKGAALMLLKDYKKAYNSFLDGLKLEPENIEMKNALSEALQALKMSDSVDMEPLD